MTLSRFRNAHLPDITRGAEFPPPLPLDSGFFTAMLKIQGTPPPANPSTLSYCIKKPLAGRRFLRFATTITIYCRRHFSRTSSPVSLSLSRGEQYHCIIRFHCLFCIGLFRKVKQPYRLLLFVIKANLKYLIFTYIELHGNFIFISISVNI